MITVRTPLRVSFFGGGSDLPAYYKEHGGAVLSTSIDKSIYVSVNKKFDDSIRLSYSQTEIVPKVEDLKHTLAKEILRHLNIDKGIEIVSIADIPSEGTGLGSSSSYTVAMLHALNAYKNIHVTKDRLGAEACEIEIEKHKQPIGKQDQYAAAFGGLNLIEFNQDDTVSVQKIVCLKETKQRLQDNLLMMYTGTTRSASGILQQQSDNMKQIDKITGMKRMVELAYIAKKQLEENNLNDFGKLLHEGWMLKKEMAGGISNSVIDDQYERALRAGAHGGKVLGAGGGGFLLLYAPKELHSDIEKALPEMRAVPFSFDHEGSKVLYYY